MEICVIDKKTYRLYEPFLTVETKAAGISKNQIALGFYNSKMALGAAVLEVEDGICDILSLAYRDEIEEGDCEEALLMFILKQKWGLLRIQYVADGDEYRMDDYDYVMLSIGFCPSDGEVKRYHAQLGTIYDRQKDLIDQYRKKHPLKALKTGSQLSKDQIEAYNRRHTYVPYTGENASDKLSCFYVKDEGICGSILAAEDDNGVLEFQWMEADGLEELERLHMIFFVIVNAIDIYPDYAEVVICPYLSEVEEVLERFGFTEDSSGHVTRVYNYYV